MRIVRAYRRFRGRGRMDAPLAIGAVLEVATDRPVDVEPVARWVAAHGAHPEPARRG